MLRRKRATASKRRKRAPSSSSGGSARSGKSARTSGRICATSTAPPASSARSDSGSLCSMYRAKRLHPRPVRWARSCFPAPTHEDALAYGSALGRTTSSASRLFPMPGSPTRRTRSRAGKGIVQAGSGSAVSRSRPTNTPRELSIHSPPSTAVKTRSSRGSCSSTARCSSRSSADGSIPSSSTRARRAS